MSWMMMREQCVMEIILYLVSSLVAGGKKYIWDQGLMRVSEAKIIERNVQETILTILSPTSIN